MSHQFEGTISHILPLQSGTSQRGNAWQSQDIVVTEDDQRYPRSICFKLFGDTIEQHKDLLSIGAKVRVSFDIDAREYQGRWYNTLTAWKLELLAHSPLTQAVIQQQTAQAYAPQSVTPASVQTPPPPPANDELPF